MYKARFHPLVTTTTTRKILRRTEALKVPLTIRLDPVLRKCLRELSRETDLTETCILERALRQHLAIRGMAKKAALEKEYAAQLAAAGRDALVNSETEARVAEAIAAGCAAVVDAPPGAKKVRSIRGHRQP